MATPPPAADEFNNFSYLLPGFQRHTKSTPLVAGSSVWNSRPPGWFPDRDPGEDGGRNASLRNSGSAATSEAQTRTKLPTVTATAASTSRVNRLRPRVLVKQPSQGRPPPAPPCLARALGGARRADGARKAHGHWKEEEAEAACTRASLETRRTSYKEDQRTNRWSKSLEPHPHPNTLYHCAQATYTCHIRLWDRLFAIMPLGTGCKPMSAQDGPLSLRDRLFSSRTRMWRQGDILFDWIVPSHAVTRGRNRLAHPPTLSHFE